MSVEHSSFTLVRDFVKTHPNQKFCMRYDGRSMKPTLREGDLLTLIPSSRENLSENDIVLAQTEEGLRIYRILLRRGDYFLLKADSQRTPAPPAELQQILGKVIQHQPYPRMRRLLDRIKLPMTGWLSTQICEFILENQSREI
jgi:SOS-response transcriptional repressor LexA